VPWVRLSADAPEGAAGAVVRVTHHRARDLASAGLGVQVPPPHRAAAPERAVRVRVPRGG